MSALFVKVPTTYAYERSAVFLRIQNILRITVRYRTTPLPTSPLAMPVLEHLRQPY